ncbi:MAG TPA: hypothetical protein VJ979_12675 [Actinomycetota bacterium]|nr:hypothetical protein [Actinomycetota bacterium]
MNANENLLRRADVAQAEGVLDAYLSLLSDDFVLHIRADLASSQRMALVTC